MMNTHMHGVPITVATFLLGILLIALPLGAAGYHSEPLIYDPGNEPIDATISETGEGTEDVDAVGASEDLDPSELFSMYTDEDIEYLEIGYGEEDEFVTVVIVFTDGSSFDFDSPMEATESDMLDDIADVLQGEAFGMSGNFDGDDLEEYAVFLEEPEVSTEEDADAARFSILLRDSGSDTRDDSEKVEMSDSGRIALMLELIALLQQLIVLLEQAEAQQ